MLPDYLPRLKQLEQQEADARKTAKQEQRKRLVRVSVVNKVLKHLQVIVVSMFGCALFYACWFVAATHGVVI